MDMYDNAKIDWHAGMELTSAVFRHWEADLDSRQQLIVRIIHIQHHIIINNAGRAAGAG